MKLPREGGLYGIKLSAGAWAGTELESTAADNPQTLGYVGKAEPGRGGLRTRWQREHLAKHSGRSSPRRSWLAVLAPAHDSRFSLGLVRKVVRQTSTAMSPIGTGNGG